MKCAECRREEQTGMYSVAYIGVAGHVLVANFCKICTRDMLGTTAYNKLRTAMEHAGWVQEGLPL